MSTTLRSISNAVTEAARQEFPTWTGHALFRPIFDSKADAPAGEMVGSDVCLQLAVLSGMTPQKIAAVLCQRLRTKLSLEIIVNRGFLNIWLRDFSPSAWRDFFVDAANGGRIVVFPRSTTVPNDNFFRVVALAAVQAIARGSFGGDETIYIGDQKMAWAELTPLHMSELLERQPRAAAAEYFAQLRNDPEVATLWIAPDVFSPAVLKKRLGSRQSGGPVVRVPQRAWFDGAEGNELFAAFRRAPNSNIALEQFVFCAAAPWASRDLDWSAALRQEQANALWYWREVAQRFMTLTVGVDVEDCGVGAGVLPGQLGLFSRLMPALWASAARDGEVVIAHQQTSNLMRGLHRFLHDPVLRRALDEQANLEPWAQIITGVRASISDMLRTDRHFLHHR